MIEINTTYPLLVTDNLAGLKDFYHNEFGFEAAFFDPGFYLHLQHPSSGSQIGFMLPSHPSQPKFLHPASDQKGVVISFDVSNAKQAFEQATARGLNIALAYTEEAWGQNHFIIRDPQGFMIDLVEYVSEQ